MTPFDPVALVAMLNAFYPVVSAAVLAFARTERPEYFAGGVLFGSKGDKLRLPDGREFDLIFAAGGPVEQRRWQCIIPGPAGDDDPFALEAGPLLPLDGSRFTTPAPASEFEGLMARGLEQLAGADTTLGSAATTVTEMTTSAAVDGAFNDTVPGAESHVSGDQATVGAYNLGDEVNQINGIDASIDATQLEYSDAPPDPEQPPDPNPGPIPTDGPVDVPRPPE